MLSFWTRRTNKPPTGQKSDNVLPLSKLDTTELSKSSPLPPSEVAGIPSEQQESSQRPSSEPHKQAPPQPISEPYVAATPNPHDNNINEIKAGLRQVESLTQVRLNALATSEHTSERPPAEALFDPATGEQRGAFDTSNLVLPSEGTAPFEHVTAEQASDEVWSHLARIRELQSDIARMHAHMEGIGDNTHVLDLDVDADIDLDSVPTQEEEEAVKRQKEFEKLPRRFTGRSENINAVMTKLDELSRAVTAFHALQPPPLNFENTTISEEDTEDISPSSLSPPMPVTMHNRQISFPTSILNQFSSDVLHDSPVSLQDSFAGSTGYQS